MRRLCLRAFAWAVPPVAMIAVVAWRRFSLPVEDSHDLAWLLLAGAVMGVIAVLEPDRRFAPWVALGAWLTLFVLCSTSGSELPHRLWALLVGVLGFDVGGGAVALVLRVHRRRHRDVV